jgi:hypothetical protein
MRADKDDKEAKRASETKLSLAELRKRLKMKPDAPFKLNAILVNKILVGPPVAALIPFGDNLYLQHDTVPRKGRAAAIGRWYYRYHPVVDGERREKREPLGNTKDLSPAQAKDAAALMRAKLNTGADPEAERAAAKAQRQAAKIQGVTLADIWAKGARPEGLSRRAWTIQLTRSWRKGGNRHSTPIDSYLDTVAAAQLSFNALQRYIAYWQDDIEPTIGHIPIVDLTPTDVARAVAPHWHKATKGEMLRWQIWDMIEYARTAKDVLIAANPAYLEKSSRIDGRRRQVGRDALSRLLGHKDEHVKQHFPALPIEDVPRFMARLRATPQAWNWLRLHPGQPDRRMLAAELIILQVGGRETAVSTARYSQVHNYPANNIRKPPAAGHKAEGQFTRGLEICHAAGKGGVSVVPLSERAWEIIITCAAEDGVDLTTPPAKRNVPIFFKSGIASQEFGGGKHWDQYLKRVAEGADPPFPDFTMHGTARSSFSDWAYAKLEAEQRPDPNGVVEMCQLHTTKTKTRAAYNRDEFYEQRRAWLEVWSQYCASRKLAPGEVINMDKHHTKSVDDTALLEELRGIMTTGQAPNLWAATALVAPRAGGKATLNGKRQRLRIKYREKYGYDDKDIRPQCEEDDLPLVDEMLALLTNHEVRSLWEATDKVADRAKGSGKRVNTRDRLYRRFEEIYGNAEKYKFRGHVDANAHLIPEIHRLLTEGEAISLKQAIGMVAHKAVSDGDPYSALRVQYLAQYPAYERFDGFVEEDAPLVKEMYDLLSAGKVFSRPDAGLMVLDRAQGDGASRDAKLQRLIRHFEETYGDEFKYAKANADAPLVKEMHHLITTKKAGSKWAATGMVADRASGDATLWSKRVRLKRYYDDTYGS